MTIEAQYWVREDVQPLAERVAGLATADEVREFVALLSGAHVSDAFLTHAERPRIDTLMPDESDPDEFLTVPDHSVIVGVHGDRGALSYQGNDGHGEEFVHLYSRGEGPGEPVLYETEEFPPDCEVPVEVIADALVEFLETAKRPTSLTWQSARDSAHP